MNKTISINGQQIAAMVFKTSKAAEKYMSKNANSKVLFIKAGQYIVSK
jgi:hypothetical protein